MDFTLLIVIIFLALVFDYINGFHDAANSIATIVATKVLTPFQAVLWAAVFNFMAYWVFGFGVADTVAKTAHTSSIDLVVILAGVIAAIIWNLLTWWKGIPSSSSHTLIGGFAGAAIAHGFYDANVPVEDYGFKIVNWLKDAKEGELLPSGVMIVILFIVFAPLLGMIISYFISLWLMYSSKKNIGPKVLTVVLMLLVLWFLSSVLKFDYVPEKAMFHNKFWYFISEPHNIKWFLVAFIFYSLAIFNLLFSSFSTATAERVLKKMQLLSSAAFSLGHGGNDSQKVMGIIAAAVMVYVKSNPDAELSIGGILDLHIDIDKGTMPGWIPLTCYTVIALGTLSGGWKIVKTMGSKITKVTAFEGVVAESAGALTLFSTEHFKIPVSTTHTITGSIIGVGVTKRVSAVRWGVTVKLLWAWILTIPVSALLAALTYYLLKLFL
ncbi:MAG: inorganic phosphate transporter [Flavobacterium sp.]|jgi:PiT family inorganic phosphate transporter|uniref:inorganic phosphate transporter n=1 Tax=Flavobacterium TaxID=237 RepID=UPI0022CA6706|nr:inorganic phosphate transporter [Flavobacterium sp.]MCZ8091169.1 inorganic phosphate transporter [Flavobacterium sp.]MCZ8329954.1 inorganic phosphate transporter [Flavobacterium sp.]